MKKQLNLKQSDYIASGATGSIYRLDSYNGIHRVIKLAKSNEVASILRNEAAIYQIMNNSCKYVPRFYEAGMYYNNLTDETVFGIVIEYINHDNLVTNMKYITSKNINKIFTNILKILECFHNHNFVVKDVKPDNFLYDPDTNRVWMVDLGLVGYCPFKWTECKNFTGTLRYISNRCHDHVNTYYDDIESSIYTVIFCYYGYLPWKIVKLPEWSDVDYRNRIKNIKESGKFNTMVDMFPSIAKIYYSVHSDDDSENDNTNQSLCKKPDYSTFWEILN